MRTLWLCLLLSLPLPATLHAGEGAPPLAHGTTWRHVLYLNSYQNGYTWSDTILEGLRQGLQQPTFRVDLQVEYLDTKKFPLALTKTLFRDLLRQKFAQEVFHAVVVSDNDAFDFMLEHGEALLPGVPVIFCGINDFKPEQLAGKPQFTGVLEHVPVRETLAMAQALMPGRTKVHVMYDASVTPTAIAAQVREAAPAFAGQLEFVFTQVARLEELDAATDAVGSDGVVYYIPFYLPEGGHSHSAEELLDRIARRTRAPVFTSWTFLMGHGALGGRMLDGRQQGQAAAAMVLRLLQGEAAASIPILPRTQDRPVFDYTLMQSFNIIKRSLPPDSQLINEPSPFYELDKKVFWTLMVSLAAMGAVLVLLARAVVQRRHAERRIVEQLGFMRLLMDTIPQLVYWKDADCRYLGANQSFADFFQLGAVEHVIGLTNRDLMSSDRYALRGEAEDREVMESNTPKYKMIWSVDRRDDVPVTLEVSKVPLHDKQGAVVGVLSTAEDITRRVSLERQLLQSQKMEAIGAFASGIAHDFNNLLTTIINSIELALLDLPPSTDAANDATRALKAARQGGDLVRQLLAYARPTREGLECTDVAERVREAAHLVRASLPASIRLQEHIAQDIPPCLVNPVQIRQIVMNLCSNAFQAMKDQGGSLELGLRLEELDQSQAEALGLPPGRHLHLRVADDGPGIPPEILDRIFDPFFTTKEKGEGTGLGLAVVQGIVTAHKGVIAVHSEPGVRTAFDIRLPCVTEENAWCAPLEADAMPGAETLVFVEDNQDQLRTMPRALARLGYTVLPFATAAQALEALAGMADALPSLVITDYDMPDINGVELARTTSQLFPDLPVVLISGRAAALDAARGCAAIREVVMKPYTAASLSRVVREALGPPGAIDRAPGQPRKQARAPANALP